MCALSVVLSSLPGSPLAPIFRRVRGEPGNEDTVVFVVVCMEKVLQTCI